MIMKEHIKNMLRRARSFLWFLRAYPWCVFHGVKYQKGVYIGRHVTKQRAVKLILSPYSRIAYNTLLWGDGTIKIGEHSSIGSCSRIFASKNGGVEIGDYTMSASHLYIIDCDHGIEAGQYIMKQPMKQAKVTIGSDVWFGYNCTVLKGVNISDGVVVGACSLVTKSIPENAVVGGVPAKVLKYRQ